MLSKIFGFLKSRFPPIENTDINNNNKIMAKIDEKINQGWLHCVIIIEIAGKPAAYIKKIMDGVLKNLEKEKNIEIIRKKIHNAKKIETVFSTFTEIEMLVSSLGRLNEIIFDFMPSSVEILEPVSLKIDINAANNLVNDLSARLHKYEEKFNKLSFEKEILINKIKELEGNKK